MSGAVGDHIRVEREYPLIWIVIDRERNANALGSREMFDLRDAIEGSCRDENASAVAITGAGEKYFSAGMDLDEISSIDDVEKAWRYLYLGLGGVIKAILDCRVPVIAAINGYAIGAGFDLIYASDVAYAVRSARLGLTAVKWGLIPPVSSTIGPALADSKGVAYLALTGDLITAEEALRLGLINDVVNNLQELKAKVREVADKFNKNDPLAVQQIKMLISAYKNDPYMYAGHSTLAAFAARGRTRERIRSLFKK
ncbi:enoyl-CoA hydratase/isomerase family protein [Acidilobus sp.]|uniref:enoyl-CoA hydratase/isomerase family protein n=1 Tax=Acidilobus sp. TaxID=1872109 RepID=UPI003D001958